MIKLTVLTLASLFAAGSLLASPEGDAIIAKEKATWEAWKNKDEAALRKLTSKDFREVTPSRIGGLDDSVASMKKTEIKSFEMNDAKVVFPDPDTGVLTYKVAMKGTQDGKDISGTYYSGAIWRKIGGEWLLVFYGEAVPEK